MRKVPTQSAEGEIGKQSIPQHLADFRVRIRSRVDVSRSSPVRTGRRDEFPHVRVLWVFAQHHAVFPAVG
nr:MAG TPA: hypothetical protein [Caudoviricetes sp.]